jgi:hypothetical protein
MPRDTAYTVEPYLYLYRRILEPRVSQQIAQTSRHTEVKPWIPACAGMTSKAKASSSRPQKASPPIARAQSPLISPCRSDVSRDRATTPTTPIAPIAPIAQPLSRQIIPPQRTKPTHTPVPVFKHRHSPTNGVARSRAERRRRAILYSRSGEARADRRKGTQSNPGEQGLTQATVIRTDLPSLASGRKRQQQSAGTRPRRKAKRAEGRGQQGSGKTGSGGRNRRKGGRRQDGAARQAASEGSGCRRQGRRGRAGKRGNPGPSGARVCPSHGIG